MDATDAVAATLALLQSLSDEDRQFIINHACPHCGRWTGEHGNCQCWNDE